MSMECNEQDYLVSFLVVSGLVLRGYEREGKGRNGELRTECRFSEVWLPSSSAHPLTFR